MGISSHVNRIYGLEKKLLCTVLICYPQKRTLFHSYEAVIHISEQPNIGAWLKMNPISSQFDQHS